MFWSNCTVPVTDTNQYSYINTNANTDSNSNSNTDPYRNSIYQCIGDTISDPNTVCDSNSYTICFGRVGCVLFLLVFWRINLRTVV